METQLIKSDGTTQEIKPENGKVFRLEELQKIVGGYIEIVYLSKTDVLVVNEDGKIINLPVNLNATKILRDYLRTSDYIVGDAVLTLRKLVK